MASKTASLGDQAGAHVSLPPAPEANLLTIPGLSWVKVPLARHRTILRNLLQPLYGMVNKQSDGELVGPCLMGIAVPHFYFDVSVGNDFARDDDGLELDSLDAAETEARRAAAGIGYDSRPKGSSSDVTVQVKDEHGQPILTVAVFTTVRRMAEALA